MTTALTFAMPTQTTAFRAIQRENKRLQAADAVTAAIGSPKAAALREKKSSIPSNSPAASKEKVADIGANVPISADVSQTFYEWLSSVRELQKDPWERKKTITSFVMLVYHTGLEIGDENGDILSKEQLDIVSKAPGWNSNEKKIFSFLKDHFFTIKELSGGHRTGITYADLQSLFSSKSKLRDTQRVSASNRGAKSGCAAGLCVQILLMLFALQFSIGLSMVLAIIGAVAGAVMQQSLDGVGKTALAGALWGISAGSAIGAGLAASQAALYFDNQLAPRVEYMRQDLKTLRFE